MTMNLYLSSIFSSTASIEIKAYNALNCCNYRTSLIFLDSCHLEGETPLIIRNENQDGTKFAISLSKEL